MAGSGLVEGAAEDLEGDGEQAVAYEDRRRLVKGLVHGRTSPAHVVVVHGGEVVMHERVAMHAFERASSVERGLLIDPEQLCRLHQEKGAEPLAAAQHRIAHRLGKIALGQGRFPWAPALAPSSSAASLASTSLAARSSSSLKAILGIGRERAALCRKIVAKHYPNTTLPVAATER